MPAGVNVLKILVLIIAITLPWATAADNNTPAPPLPGGGSLARNLLGKSRATSIEDPQLNVRILVPSGFENWPEGTKLNPGFSHTLIDRSRTLFVGISGGDIGVSTGDDTVSVAMSQYRIMCQGQPQCAFTEPSPLPGVDGWSWWTQEGVIGGARLHFAHAVRFNQGFLHQATVWSTHDRAADVDKSLIRIATACTLLDPKMVSKGVTTASGGNDPELGVHIVFPEDGWFIPTAETIPLEAFCSRIYARLDQRWMGITSLDCSKIGLPTSGEIVQTLLNVTGSAQQEVSATTVDDKIEATWRASADPNAPVYVVRVWLLSPRIVIVIGSADDWSPASIARLRAVISAVEPLRESAPSPISPSLGAAELANQFGLTTFANGAYDRAAAWFASSVALSPKTSIYRKNLLHVLASSGREEDLLDAVHSAHAVFPDDQEISAQLARAQVTTGDLAAGVAGYAKIFATGFRDQEHLARYLAGLRAIGTPERVSEALEAYLNLGMDEGVLIALANEYADVGDFSRALTTLKRMGSSPDIAFARARILRQAGRAEEALEFYRSQRELHGPELEIELAVGETLLELQRLDEALAAFSVARDLAPQDSRSRQYIALVQRMLGRGDSLELCDELEAVPLPESLRQSTEGGTIGDHAIVLHQSTAVRWRPEELYRRTDRQRIRILDQAGVEQYTTMHIPFDPVSDDIQVHRLAVYDATGTLIAEGRPHEYYCMDRGDAAVTGGERIAILPVPAITPGVEIELEVTLRKRSRTSRFPFLNWQVVSMVPVLEASLSVDAPIGTLTWSCPSVPLNREPVNDLQFRVTGCSAFRFEPLMDIAASIPCVHVVDTAETWEDIADSYLSEIEPLLVPDEVIKSRAAKLVADLGHDAGVDEVISRLTADVQKFSYRASSFGYRGRIPASADRTLADRSGDCKALSVLLLQYLRACGIEANLALVSVGEVFSTSTPAFDQFDHMIVHLPDGRFIDPTIKHLSPLIQPPRGLERRTALALIRGHSSLIPIPDIRPHSSSLHRQTRVELLADGSAMFRERYESRGIYATDLRTALEGLDDLERSRFARELIAITPYQVDRVAITTPSNLNEAVVIEAAWRQDQGFLPVRGLLAGRLLTPWERRYFFQSPCPRRMFPFRIPFPLDCSASILVVPPEGFHFIDLPEPIEAWEDCWHSMRRSIKLQADGTIEVQLTILQRSERSPATVYESFQESAARVLRSAQPMFVLSQ